MVEEEVFTGITNWLFGLLGAGETSYENKIYILSPCTVNTVN